jgi:hypothetical protein
MSSSTTASIFPIVLWSSVVLEAHLQAPLVDVSRKSLYCSAVQLSAPNNVPEDSSPNADAEEDFIPTFVDCMKIILCPQVTVVDVEHALMHKTCFTCPQNCM